MSIGKKNSIIKKETTFGHNYWEYFSKMKGNMTYVQDGHLLLMSSTTYFLIKHWNLSNRFLVFLALILSFLKLGWQVKEVSAFCTLWSYWSLG